MGKDEIEKKLESTTTHLNQIELKVSKLLSEGSTPKEALATVKTQEEALRVKKAQLNEALGAFVTHVTRFTLNPDGNMEPCQDDGLGFVEQEIESPVGLSAGSDPRSTPGDAISNIMGIGHSGPTGEIEPIDSKPSGDFDPPPYERIRCRGSYQWNCTMI